MKEIHNNSCRISSFIPIIENEVIALNKDYISTIPGLEELIHSEIINWVQEVTQKLEAENPFLNEEKFIENLASVYPVDVMKNLSGIQRQYLQVSQFSGINFEFYRKEWDSSLNERKASAISSALIEKMQTECRERKSQWERETIEILREEFILQLLANLMRFRKWGGRFPLEINRLDYQWGLSKAEFRETDIGDIRSYSQLLEKDAGLKRLAEIIGKHNLEENESSLAVREYHRKSSYKGRITGMKLSNDISSTLPAELALYHHPATKKLFELKLVQNQLLSFQYENRNPVMFTEMENIQKEIQKGPVIICVDTSGSMEGVPEKIAKTITYALTKIAMEEERKCYLISFSTNIQTISLSSDEDEIVACLSNLIDFLQNDFRGGTNPLPALAEALEMLSNEDYRNADVLFISDFMMRNLSSEIIQKIEEEKRKGSDFYSLIIGNSGNRGVVQIFNKNWYYDISGRNGGRVLVEVLPEEKK